jgi:type II secretory pathway pseudopilin PulG
MKAKYKQSGITLMEMTVVVAAVALLAVFGLPAIRAFFNSLESKGPAEAMIDAALSSARAIAIKERHYAGIRFQKAYDPKGQLEAPQYMVFIIHDFDKTGLADGFRAVEGVEPIRLPDSVGVMDLRRNKDEVIDSDGRIYTLKDVNDTTTFSIVFSPSGKLVIHDVRTRNRDGTASSKDDIFNTLTKITHPTDPYGMFVEDAYPELGLEEEPSRNSFIIYERDKFRAAFENRRAWSGYLENLASQTVYINPYTGTIIER